MNRIPKALTTICVFLACSELIVAQSTIETFVWVYYNPQLGENRSSFIADVDNNFNNVLLSATHPAYFNDDNFHYLIEDWSSPLA
jgi:hypothetical protein